LYVSFNRVLVRILHTFGWTRFHYTASTSIIKITLDFEVAS